MFYQSFIEDEEDIELAQVQVQKISTYIQAFGGMLNQYQAETQNAIKCIQRRKYCLSS